jgi:hypothetical protein
MKIPGRPAELTPEWLSDALAASLDGARVESVAIEPLGEGEGFVGTLVRLRLGLDRPVDGVPTRMIAKLPTSVAANRATGELLGAYEREVFFYRELASRVSYRTPAVYVAMMDDNPASKHGEAVIRFIDRLPRWLLRALMSFFGWVAGRSRRRYLLLIEDLAPARVGDQVEGRSPAECEPVLRAIAEAQAPLWQSPLLAEHYWITPMGVGLRIGHEMFLASRPVFERRFAAQLSSDDRHVLDWLELHAPALQQALHRDAPVALVHGDFRLDNLLFDDELAPRVVDWQGVGRGPAPYDVAYFLSGTLLPDVTVQAEDALVAGYHRALVDGGVREYHLADCLRDYRRSMLGVLHRMVTIDRVELGTGRGVDLFDLWVERIFARIAGIDRDALLPAPVATT